ncbi:MAG TPA: carbon monoxide dehydrogenase subunit G [Ramlibacter sp.]|nr:carbon monoxide dehydrogenase subunit G [Ramlibacter sp.]
MEMQGSRSLAVSQAVAWAELNNPEVLKACIPGCDRLEASGDNQYALGVAVKVGPVSARFGGKIVLSDIVAPQSYTIAFDGQGGAAGFGKGVAKVRLAPEGSGCLLDYNVTAQVGGKIAQVGQRLIDGVAKSMAEDFFKRFDAQMRQRHPEAYALAEAAAAAAASTPVAPPPPPPPTGAGIPTWAWAVGAAVLLAAVLWLTQ